MIPFPLLSLIVFWPLAGGLLCLAFWRYPQPCRWVALGTAVVEMLLVLVLLFSDLHPDPVQGWLLVEDFSWIERFNIRYSLGLDGISLLLLLLTALLIIMSILISWQQVTARVGMFFFMLLLTQSAVMGVFLATDLFLFYLFWELQLVPMLFLIGIWGHEKRVYAAVKFFLFNITGGLLMLAALIGLYLAHGRMTGNYTFDLQQLLQARIAPHLQMWFFGAFLLSFAIKIPVFPLHTWLPDAHTEAPTAGSVILAGLLLKTGCYALLRVGVPVFPEAAARFMPVLMTLGLAGIMYAAWIALAQRDMKRLVAYSSIGHMGLLVIGLAVWNTMTLTGAVLQMVNHGITTAALFILVGMLDERFHTRELAHFGGIWKTMPVFSGFFLLFAMASLGMPGLNNFVSEIIILLGVFRVNPVLGSLAFVTVVVTLVYVLRLVQDTLYGACRDGNQVPDINGRELVILLPLALAALGIGLYPGPLLALLQEPVSRLVQQTGQFFLSGLM
jgi:NADH-quinone oxidoreductase subunit M